LPEAPANERPYTVRARGCIACGTENPFSLGLRPYRDGDKVVCELRIRREFRGYSNVAHGGTTCMVLDEIMGAAASVTLPETVVATVRLSVDYARPVRVEEPLRGEAWVVSHEGRDLTIEGRLLDEEGTLLARANGTFRTLSSERAKEFVTRSTRPEATSG
jgi:uncharacterized protein (TIGR00369 family)